MKPYRDIFGNKIPKKDVESAVRLMVRENKVSAALLQRSFKWGYMKASRIIGVVEDAGIIRREANQHPTILLNNEDQAVNASLRQLKKGRA